MAGVQGVEALIQFPDGSKVISWLPAAHIAERMAHHYLPIVFAMTITTCPNPREIVAYLPAVKPTWFFAVPRIWEKLKAGLEGYLPQREDASRPRRGSTARAQQGRARAGRRGGARGPRGAPSAEADEQLFAGMRAMLGLDEAIAVNVGAAPTPREVLVFFHAIGVPLAELWGMSETCGAGAVQPARADQDRHGRPAVAGRRGAARRRRRAADPLRRRDDRLPQPARPDRRGDRRRRLAAHRRHRARSTTTATSRSSTARRRSSSTRPARTCRRRTSSRRSRAPAR